MDKKTQLEIANYILQNCFWGNMSYTPEFIVENIHNKALAQNIFSAVFENSQDMMRDLSIIDRDLVCEFIISQNQRLGHFKRLYLEPRLDYLIKEYGIKNAGKRREIQTII